MASLLGHHHPLLQASVSSFLPSTHRKVSKKKATLAMGCVQQQGKDTRNEGSGLQRRCLVLVGISVLPLLKLRAAAAQSPLDGIPPKGVEQPEGERNYSISTSKQPLVAKQSLANAFLSLLNAVGILGSGVLAALYAISKEDRAAMESTVESMESLLNAKQTAITSLEESFELRMLEEREERQKQVKKLREEEVTLSNELASANLMISSLSQELRMEKRTLGELKLQLNQLLSSLVQINEEKKMLEVKIKENLVAIDGLQGNVGLLNLEIKGKEKSIEVLKAGLADREREAVNLKSIIEQSMFDCQNANSTAEQLKTEVRQIREDLNCKSDNIIELSSKIELLVGERDDNRQKFQDLKQEFDDFRSASASKAEADSKILSEKDQEMQALEERLALVVDDARKSKDLVEKMMIQRDGARAMVEEEMENVDKLQKELEFIRESLEAAKLKVSDLSSQLMESRGDHKRLEMEISRVRSESLEAETSLRQDVDEARSASNVLSEELVSVNGILQKTEEALRNMTEELKTALEDQVALKRELLGIYKKIESTGKELEEARSTVTSLELELETSFKQLMSGNEAREALAGNLNEVTQALDEMTQASNSLSRELESVRSTNVDLERENNALSKSLSDQRRVTLEAKENIEDAQNLLHRLLEERDNLEKWSTKLEEDLAMAKGEILRLRRGSSSRRASSRRKAVDVKNENTGANGVKKNDRNGATSRRRATQSSEVVE